MSVSKLILSSARRYIAYAAVDIYKNHSFRQRERERERERELNFIIFSVVQYGAITGAWVLEDLPPEILSILSGGLFNIYHILSFKEWFTTYNV